MKPAQCITGQHAILFDRFPDPVVCWAIQKGTPGDSFSVCCLPTFLLLFLFLSPLPCPLFLPSWQLFSFFTLPLHFTTLHLLHLHSRSLITSCLLSSLANTVNLSTPEIQSPYFHLKESLGNIINQGTSYSTSSQCDAVHTHRSDSKHSPWLGAGLQRKSPSE